MAVLPEIIIIFTAFLVLSIDLITLKKNSSGSYVVALIGILVAASAVVAQFGTSSEILGGRFVVDSVSLWFKLIFLIATGLTLSVSVDSFLLKGEMKHYPEFISVMLFSLSGMMFLISSTDLVSLYVSLELATIPLLLPRL